MCALARTPSKAPSRSHTPASKDAKAPAGQGQAAQDALGNAFLKDQIGAAEDEGSLLLDDEECDQGGALGLGVVGAALSAAFGDDLSSVSLGEDAAGSEQIGADAYTKGSAVALGGGVDAQDAADPASMEIVAHEVAHALAGGGSGEEEVDAPGDRGEIAADTAGKQFRKWAEAGFQGDAPSLAPAEGGKAAVHRHPTAPVASTLDGNLFLKRGSRGASVVLLQQLLAKVRQWVSADGDFGPITEKAVKAFQRAQGLLADGVVGPKTAEALNRAIAAPAPAPAPAAPSGPVEPNGVYQVGSKGGEVKEVQKLLAAKGANLVIDGDFGAQTKKAVIAFQSVNGLAADGVVGRNTLAALKDPASRRIPANGGQTPAQNPAQQNPAQQPVNPAPGADSNAWRDRVLNAAAGHLGARYYWGADGPGMFDCSGFVLYVLRQDTGLIRWGDDNAAGIKNRLPRANSPKKGDLVFYSGSGGVEHVEMYTGSGSTEIGCSGGGSRTFGDDPGAKVQYGDMNADGRSRSYGSIQPLIDAKE